MPEDDALQLCLLLAKADAEVRRRLDRTLSGIHGLSLHDFTILWSLRRSPEGRLRRVDLADRLVLTASGITRLLLPLEKLGFVSRQSDADDGRVALATLTRQGRTLADHSTATATESAAEMLDGRFTADELATLRSLLSRLAPV